MREGTDLSAAARGTAGVVCALMLTFEAAASVAMWAGIPLAWLWIGGRLYALTGSLSADIAVAFFGFVGTLFLALAGLRRLDRSWIALRRRAGYEQDEGALARIVVGSATLALLSFFAWYYLLSDAYVLPFMPSN